MFWPESSTEPIIWILCFLESRVELTGWLTENEKKKGTAKLLLAFCTRSRLEAQKSLDYKSKIKELGSSEGRKKIKKRRRTWKVINQRCKKRSVSAVIPSPIFTIELANGTGSKLMDSTLSEIMYFVFFFNSIKHWKETQS